MAAIFDRFFVSYDNRFEFATSTWHRTCYVCQVIYGMELNDLYAPVQEYSKQNKRKVIQELF